MLMSIEYPFTAWLAIDKPYRFIDDSDMPSHKNIANISLRLPRFTILSVVYRLITDWSDAVPVRAYWRIFWHPEPGASIEAGATTYPLLPDRLLLVPPYLRVRHHLHRPTGSFAFHVELESSTGMTLAEPYYPELPEEMIDRLRQIPNAYPGGAVFFAVEKDEEPRMVWLLRELVCRSFQYLPPAIWEHAHRDSRVEHALHTLHQRRIEGCANAELARQANLCTNAFIRLFRQYVGVPPQTYLQNLRLDHAARLLHTSERAVDQIAAECGFCDRNYLTKLFKRRFHVGPAQYRRQDG